MLALLSALAALASTPPESDRAGQLGVLERVQAAQVVAMAVRISDGASTRIEVQPPDGEPFVLVDTGNPDRVALSDDGRQVAWVSAITGLASVYTAPAKPGAAPQQLTNVGLERADRVPGQAPAGWIAPPHDHSLHFVGNELVWSSPDGEHRAVWR